MEHLPKLARFSSKLVLQILPSVSATVIGGYLLAQIHIGQHADPSPPPIVVTPQTQAAPPSPQAPTAGEEPAAIRKVLKQRRENPETPEVVHPVAAAQPVPPPATTANANVSPPASAVTASVSPPAAT